MTNLAKTKTQSLEITGATLQSVGLTFTRQVSEAEWTQAGETLATINGATMFWIGDWATYAQTTWGDRYSELIEETGYDYGTLRDSVWVCSAIEMSRRRDKLSFAHHREVARLEKKEQDYWLATAERLGLTRQELRASVKAGKVVRAVDAGEAAQKAGFDSIERLPLDFNRIYQKTFGEEDIAQCRNTQRLQTWIESTQPMADANRKARTRLAEIAGLLRTEAC